MQVIVPRVAELQRLALQEQTVPPEPAMLPPVHPLNDTTVQLRTTSVNENPYQKSAAEVQLLRCNILNEVFQNDSLILSLAVRPFRVVTDL
jgi:hypothetical protein